ncbi:MAG TPA: hypoxanthine phosphoribosyltransferase [Flavobacteriales bacterium]|nr:hypoxanthine phosphoribosyltransferase [Flavobacteriales bacterium]
MNVVQLHDKKFTQFIPFSEIDNAIGTCAQKINAEYEGKNPVFVAVLNGSFMFAADLLKKITVECEISFVKLASYHGISSTGSVTELIGFTENVEGRHVIILEDIVDTGLTLEKVLAIFSHKNCASVKVATLLLKPEAYKKDQKIDYACMEIPNAFIVGYGLDYDGLGRNLKDIYRVI